MSRLTTALCLFALACGGSSKPEPADPPTIGADEVPSAAIEIAVFTSPEAAGAVNSVLLSGPTEVVIVDAQFTKSGAVAVADMAESLGKKVTRVFVTHVHPDHFLGTAVLEERFPDARFVASPAIAAEMEKSAAAIAEARRAMLGPEFPGMPVIPQPIDRLVIDGVEVELLDTLAGDTDPITGLFVKDSGTLIASDVVYSDIHLWTATTDHDGRMAWAKQTEELAKLPGLERVIPGHQLDGSAQTVDALAYTGEYIRAFDAARERAKSGDELINAMKQKYPDAKGELFLQIGANAAFGAAK